MQITEGDEEDDREDDEQDSFLEKISVFMNIIVWLRSRSCEAKSSPKGAKGKAGKVPLSACKIMPGRRGVGLRASRPPQSQ